MKNRGESIYMANANSSSFADQPEGNRHPGVELQAIPHVGLSWGAYSHKILRKQVQAIAKHQDGVLARLDPEPLHQMRVALRRLRTGLQVFGPALLLPKSLQLAKTRKFAQRLGELRDLDVQSMALRETYHPQLQAKEANLLTQVHTQIVDHHDRAFHRVRKVLTGAQFHRWQRQWETWLETPRFQGCHDWDMGMILPDLLTPMLSEFLLHPGWGVTLPLPSSPEAEQLHNLRKVCKHLRYRAEFFAPFYPPAFKTWIQQLKDIQDCLGQVQDAEVLVQLLAGYTPITTDLPGLDDLIQRDRANALDCWQQLRQDYLNPQFRYERYQLLLHPISEDLT